MLQTPSNNNSWLPNFTHRWHMVAKRVTWIGSHLQRLQSANLEWRGQRKGCDIKVRKGLKKVMCIEQLPHPASPKIYTLQKLLDLSAPVSYSPSKDFARSQSYTASLTSKTEPPESAKKAKFGSSVYLKIGFCIPDRFWIIGFIHFGWVWIPSVENARSWWMKVCQIT